MDEEEEENNMFVQSTFLPAHLIGEMMSEKPKDKSTSTAKKEEKESNAPNYEAMDEEELE